MPSVGQSWAIRTASLLWSGMSELMRFGIRVGMIRPFPLGCRVISVGNIQVGGAGKTPLVARIAQEAVGQGLRVCILSRGYRSEWESCGGVLLPEEKISAEKCGDEPALLRDLCPQAYIGIGFDRIKQYHAVLDRAGHIMDLVILDDGFQHWKIKKDVEVVAITSASPWKVLFRDSKQALKNADLVVWTKGEVSELPALDHAKWVKAGYRLAPGDKGLTYWLVTGVANGESVRVLAEDSGYRISRHINHEDHAQYTRAQVQDLLQAARQGGAKIALTGKDWVKWREYGVSQADVAVLEPDLVIASGQENWDQVLWGKSAIGSMAGSIS